jgi:tyrosinase
MQDPKNRMNAVPMVGNVDYKPEASYVENVKERRQQDPRTATIDLEWLAPEIKLMDAADQLGGAGGLYCYVYI